MNRHELKTAFLQMDYSYVKEKKEIIVDLRYVKNKWWPGYGYVTIRREGKDGMSEFSTHQEHPLQYAKDRMNDKDSHTDYSEYELIIKE